MSEDQSKIYTIKDDLQMEDKLKTKKVPEQQTDSYDDIMKASLLGRATLKKLKRLSYY